MAGSVRSVVNLHDIANDDQCKSAKELAPATPSCYAQSNMNRNIFYIIGVIVVIVIVLKLLGLF